MFIELIDGRLLCVMYIQDLLIEDHYVIYLLANGRKIKEKFNDHDESQIRYDEVRDILLKAWGTGGGGGTGPAGPGVSSGGVLNDVLVKTSGVNYATAWRKIIKANLATALQDEIDGKVNVDQGITNAGKVLGIDTVGKVTPVVQSSGEITWIEY